jgi:arylsulfatase A-like enzyme
MFLPPFDLLPFVNGNIKGRPHETLFWDTGSYQAVIAGDWKLHHVNPVKAKPFRNDWLFNMKDDPTEQVNLADTRADKVNELQTILQAFNQNDKVKPLWPSLLEGPIRIDETINQSWEKEDEYVIWSN